MKRFGRLFAIGLVALALCVALTGQMVRAQQPATAKSAPAPAVTDEETSVSVPALNDLHKVVHPLWHDAYAKKDYAMIKELLPRADTLVAALDAAKLPGILHEKQEAWDAGKANLKSVLGQLHDAAKADNQEMMLKQTAAFHAAFERLARTIHPVTPQLAAFHEELYKLYHNYMPKYDLAKIREAAAAMEEKVSALKEAQMPKPLADRQEKYNAAVLKLEGAVKELSATVKTDAKDKIQAAVEKVHAAYQEIEKLLG
ncbi:MAG: hypothetical protein ABR899_02570 [Candidatus Krumholzibacteriaceae bacterium]|jgi:hypothetical protein